MFFKCQNAEGIRGVAQHPPQEYLHFDVGTKVTIGNYSGIWVDPRESYSARVQRVAPVREEMLGSTVYTTALQTVDFRFYLAYRGYPFTASGVGLSGVDPNSPVKT